MQPGFKRGAPPFTKTTDAFDPKLDYDITEKDRLSGRANGAFQATGISEDV